MVHTFTTHNIKCSLRRQEQRNTNSNNNSNNDSNNSNNNSDNNSIESDSKERVEIKTACLEEQLVDDRARLAFLGEFPITQEYEAIYNFIHEEEEEIGKEEDIERRLNHLQTYPMIRHYEEMYNSEERRVEEEREVIVVNNDE
ncbi:hypothetical protein F8M41_024827 [Gigaspora margarita]|uniref:Uncharacterized protein n=1 Tax=Gigaspora margarita TaxID=4874 RepID=A0A8H4AAB4_GIGMA|nr:hypothetical protein F8M41_024827 [Gigaspora margarita]